MWITFIWPLCDGADWNVAAPTAPEFVAKSIIVESAEILGGIEVKRISLVPADKSQAANPLLTWTEAQRRIWSDFAENRARAWDPQRCKKARLDSIAWFKQPSGEHVATLGVLCPPDYPEGLLPADFDSTTPNGILLIETTPEGHPVKVIKEFKGADSDRDNKRRFQFSSITNIDADNDWEIVLKADLYETVATAVLDRAAAHQYAEMVIYSDHEGDHIGSADILRD